MYPLLFDSGPYDSGPTIQAARFRPDTIQAEHDSGRKFYSNVKYKCDQCDKSFPLKTHLNRHIKSVHENVRFKCDKCDKSYPWKSQLIRHIKIVHAKFKD